MDFMQNLKVLLSMVKSTELLFPDLCDICFMEHRQMHRRKRTPMLQKCYCRYLGGAGQKYIRRMQPLLIGIEKVALFDIERLSLLTQIWNRYKLVYQLVDEAYPEAEEMHLEDVYRIQSAKLMGLPKWPFYLTTPFHKEYEGLLCAFFEDGLGADGGPGEPFLMIAALHKDPDYYSCFAIYIKDNWTVGDAVLNTAAIKEASNVKGTLDTDSTVKLVGTAIPLLMDIAARKGITGPMKGRDEICDAVLMVLLAPLAEAEQKSG